MRGTLMCLVLFVFAHCHDVRSFKGDWQGQPDPAFSQLQSGITAGQSLSLTVDEVTKRTLSGTLEIQGLLDSQTVKTADPVSIDLAEAISLNNGELSTYLLFATPADGMGDATLLVSLYTNEVVEVRLVRNQPPLYGVWRLERP